MFMMVRPLAKEADGEESMRFLGVSMAITLEIFRKNCQFSFTDY